MLCNKGALLAEIMKRTKCKSLAQLESEYGIAHGNIYRVVKRENAGLDSFERWMAIPYGWKFDRSTFDEAVMKMIQNDECPEIDLSDIYFDCNEWIPDFGLPKPEEPLGPIKVGDDVISIARDVEGHRLKVIAIDSYDESLPYKCLSYFDHGIYYKSPTSIRLAR